MHAGIVFQSRLMKIDVESFVGFHLQGCLHACLRIGRLRRIICQCFLHQPPDFGQARLRVIILLIVIITRYPKSRMISSHCKLRMFFPNNEVVQITRQRKLVTEAHAVIKNPKTYFQLPLPGFLVKCDKQLVIVIADFTFFAPHGCPRLVKSRGVCGSQSKAVH